MPGIKIQNKKERNTTIWQFIAFAIIPLLLTFIAGYSIGNTKAEEENLTGEQITTLTSERDKMKNEIEKQLVFESTYDSLMKVMKEEVEDLDEELSEAYRSEDDDEIVDWGRSNKNFEDDWKDETLANLEKKYSGENFPIFGARNIEWVKLFEDIVELNHDLLSMEGKKKARELRLQNNEDLDEQIKTLDEKIEELEDEIEDKEDEIEDLKEENQKTKGDASKASSSANEDLVLYKSSMKDIGKLIGQIEQEIIPELNIKTKFLGINNRDRDKLQAIKDKLDGYLDQVRDLTK